MHLLFCWKKKIGQKKQDFLPRLVSCPRNDLVKNYDLLFTKLGEIPLQAKYFKFCLFLHFSLYISYVKFIIAYMYANVVESLSQELYSWGMHYTMKLYERTIDACNKEFSTAAMKIFSLQTNGR